MDALYLIVLRHEIRIFKKEGNKYIPKSVHGNCFFEYNLSTCKEDIETLKRDLAIQFNYSSTSALKFYVLNNADEIVNEIVLSYLGENVINSISLGTVLLNYFESNKGKDALLLEKFGFNYDECCYLFAYNKIQKSNFSLLAHCVDAEEIVSYC